MTDQAHPPANGKPASEEWETLQRYSLAHGVSGDGIAPVTIEGDLVKFIDANRYAVNASRRLPMPDNHAPTFKRPRASQFTANAVQATVPNGSMSSRVGATSAG